MKKSLSEIAKSKGNNRENTVVGRSSESFGRSADNPSSDSINELYGRYAGKSESDLLSELYLIASEQKKEGTFDRTALENGIRTIMPMLNEEQKRRLNEIAAKL